MQGNELKGLKNSLLKIVSEVLTDAHRMGYYIDYDHVMFKITKDVEEKLDLPSWSNGCDCREIACEICNGKLMS